VTVLLVLLPCLSFVCVVPIFEMAVMTPITSMWRNIHRLNRACMEEYIGINTVRWIHTLGRGLFTCELRPGVNTCLKLFWWGKWVGIHWESRRNSKNFFHFGPFCEHKHLVIFYWLVVDVGGSDPKVGEGVDTSFLDAGPEQFISWRVDLSMDAITLLGKKIRVP